MLGAWLLVQTAALMAIQAQAVTPKTMQLPGNVKVTYESGVYDITTDTWAFDSGVVVDYDVTEIRADHVDIDEKNQHGSATGHVELDDPIARVRADKLEVWWAIDGQRGHAENAEVNLGSSHLKVKTLDIGPKLWVLQEVEITTSIAHPPWYEVHSPLLSVQPGKLGKLKKPTIYILGHRIVTVPDQTFNLDKRTEGVAMPGINYSRQYGLGASWGGGFLLDHRTDLNFSVGSFPDSRPGYGVTVSRSLLPDDKPITFLTPLSDFGERFFYGFLENIAIASPESEDRQLRSPRQTISVDSVWNQALFDRDSPNAFSKAIEGVYEVGGKSGPFGFISQARLQTINELGYPFITRLQLIESIGPPQIQITPTLHTLTRLDADVFLDSGAYEWVRGQAGLAFQPIPQFRLSAGAYYSGDAGNPQLPIDPLLSRDGYLARADLLMGPTKASYLIKHDPNLGWYDHEYSISQVVGCFEPFLMYRESPSYYQLGLRLRLDNLTDLLTQRNFKRTQPVMRVISPLPNGNP